MRYLIFVPTTESKPDGGQLLASVGLQDHAKGFDSLPCTGPNQMPGYLFGWLDHVQSRLSFDPDKQTWIPSIANGDLQSGAYWVGIWNDSPPTEQDMRRPEARRGAWIAMADGSTWQLPAPATLERYPQIVDGKLSWVVDEAFAWFVQEIDRRKALLTIDENSPGRAIVSWDLDQDFWFIVRSLRINYRIVPEVVVHRRLISMSTLKSLTTGLLGYTLLEE